MDPRIQIRIHTKISWIRNTSDNCSHATYSLKLKIPSHFISHPVKSWAVGPVLWLAICNYIHSLLPILTTPTLHTNSRYPSDINEQQTEKNEDVMYMFRYSFIYRHFILINGNALHYVFLVWKKYEICIVSIEGKKWLWFWFDSDIKT